jgi:cytoskeleton protein RodZ
VLERAAQVPAELGRSVATLLAAVDDAPRAAVLVAARPADPPPSPTAVPHLAALNAPERPFRPTVQSAMREPDSAVEGISPAEPPAIGAAHAAAPPATPRIVLVAREESWIQVRSATRDYVHSVTLQPGDRFVTPDRDDLALWTGNAGGLEVLIDGASRGRLGERGRVIRSVSLSPEALAQRLHAIE